MSADARKMREWLERMTRKPALAEEWNAPQWSAETSREVEALIASLNRQWRTK